MLSAGPLKGFKVLDLTRILAGPYCSMLLADMGADVVKVESFAGDDTRSWGPPFVKGESTYFLGVNRNKRSVCIDLKNAAGVALVHRLAARSDVVLENFVPGVADRLGVGYEALRRTNPALIFGSISGFGSRGPARDRLAYDMFIQAYGGLMSITGPPGGEPSKVGVALTDVTTGMLMSNAVVAALLARERSSDKSGQRIDTSLFEAQLATLVNVASATLIADAPSVRHGTAHPSIVPYQVFAAKDAQFVAVGALNEQQHARLLEALRSECSGDADALAVLQAPHFATNAGRVERRREYVAALQRLLLQKPPADWQRVFDARQIPCSPVHTVKEAFALEQAAELDMVAHVDHPLLGALPLVGVPVKMSGTPWRIARAPPLLGQHTDEILAEAGMSASEIGKLRENRVVK